jgi:hypothetical protein
MRAALLLTVLIAPYAVLACASSQPRTSPEPVTRCTTWSVRWSNPSEHRIEVSAGDRSTVAMPRGVVTLIVRAARKPRVYFRCATADGRCPYSGRPGRAQTATVVCIR